MIYIIVGPTGSGKTKTAIELADYFHAPIVNADAFQIYQDMNVGTAKISKDDPHYKDHYLLDIKKPSESYSVKEYQTDFRKTVDTLQKSYKDIIVCGGTGLYIRASIYDYLFLDEGEINTDEFEKYSNDELWEMLLKNDKEATLNLHKNNRKRVIRALALASSGTNKSEVIAKQEHKLIYNDVVIYMLSPNREQLYENINKRVDEMFANGLVDEVKGLLKKYDLSQTASQAIGYKEVISYLNNEISLEDCIELVKKRTRNYAKRQVTFFKNQFDLKTFENAEDLIKEAKKNG